MTNCIIDTFMFFNEINMLKARLNYLNDTVDYFVLEEWSKQIKNRKDPCWCRNNSYLKYVPFGSIDDYPHNYEYIRSLFK